MRLLPNLALIVLGASTAAQATDAAHPAAPITATFNDTNLRAVFDALGEKAGVKVLYDNDFRDKKVSVAFREETFESALKEVTLTQRLFTKELFPRTIVVVPDVPQKHRIYDAWSASRPLSIVGSRGGITLSFKDKSLRKILDALGEAAGVAIVYDADFRDRTMSIGFDAEPFEAALDQLVLVNHLFYRPVGAHSIVIAPDTPQIRRRYDDAPPSGSAP
jgi:type II secretory pathway component GspD/PulD (secretin)